MRVHLYNSFTKEDGTGGNRAAVVRRDNLSEVQMQDVAKKLQLSEVAFFEKIQEEMREWYKALFYTPKKRVALCGHATIALGKHLFTERGVDSPTEMEYVHQDDRTDQTTIKQLDNMVFYKQFTDAHSGHCDPSELMKALDLRTDDIDWSFSQTICFTDVFIAVRQEVFANLPENPDFNKIENALKKLSVPGANNRSPEGLHIFCLGKEGVTAHCRNSAPGVGINEEPATGSACALLAHELVKQEIITPDKNATYLFVQGEQMESGGGEIFVKYKDNEVWVGGRVEKADE